ncbi:MAG: DUF5606 domain-containing protein [Bacteroidota bacterium]
MHPLHQIVQVPGNGGVHRIITTSKQGYILQSIDAEQRRWHAPAQTKVAALEEIAIYTQEDQVPLWNVFRKLWDLTLEDSAIQESLGNEANTKAMFERILPNYHTGRVYVSDMRKVLRWYLALKAVVDFGAELADSEKSASEGV